MSSLVKSSKVYYKCGGCDKESYYYPEYADSNWINSNKLCGMCYYGFHEDEVINKKAFHLRTEDESSNAYWLKYLHPEYLN